MSAIPARVQDLLLGAAAELGELLRAEIDDDVKLVQKGLLLYRQGLVSGVKLDSDLLSATVQDVTKVHVELNLNFFLTSTCSCPQEGLCRHQLAAFFHVYAQVASVSQWVEEWRQPLQERKNAKTWGIQRAKELLKTAGSLKPDYDRWVGSLQESFQSMMYAQKNLKPYLVNDLFQVFTRRLKAGAPVEQEWRQLYFLIASVHSFRSLLQLSTDYGFSEEDINRYYRETFYTLMDEIEDLVHKLHIQALPFAFDTFIERLREDTRLLVTDEYTLEFEPIHLYRILWTGLFKKKSWHEAELHTLSEQKQTFPVVIAHLHQNFLLKEDDKTIHALQLLEEEGTPFLIYWLETLSAAKDWARMQIYVEELAASIKPFLQQLSDPYARLDFTRLILSIMRSYSFETKRFDVYEKIMIMTLPYSYNALEHFLFDSGSYRRWADLQTYIGYDIGSIPSDRIKILQKEEPAVLLPLYHHSIQRHINMKNRGNYREAVRLLKKLRTLYKKLKKQKEWEQFMKILLEKTKRLRAFHEECERGKLTHA